MSNRWVCSFIGIAACLLSIGCQPQDVSSDVAAVDSSNGCTQVTLGASVDATNLAGNPPIAAGGRVPEGRFTLRQLTLFTGSGGATGPAGVVYRGGRIVSGSSIQLRLVRGTDLDIEEQYTYSGLRNALSLTRTCPQPGVSEEMSYEVSGGGLTLFLPGAAAVFR